MLVDESKSVSIVIPCYQGIRFFDQVANSLQPYHDQGYEIIFVEDGSNDGIKEKINAHLPKAKYIWQENKGPAAARYNGVTNASGAYIQLLDIDDTISADKLSKQVEFAQKHQLALVYSAWRYAIDDGNEVKFKPWIENEVYEDVPAAIFSGWWFPPAAAIVSKEAYLAVDGGNTSLRSAGDEISIYLKLFAENYRFGYCPGQFTNYYKYSSHTSLSQNRTTNWWKNVATARIEAIDLMVAKGSLSDIQRSTGMNYLFWVARNLAPKEMEEARKIWSFIIRIAPDFQPAKESSAFMTIFNWFGYIPAERFSLLLRKLRGTQRLDQEISDFIYEKITPKEQIN